MSEPHFPIEDEADDDDSYMVTGLRNGYRTTLVRDLSYEEAKDLKTRLNRGNAYVNASIAPQGNVAVNEHIPIDDILREWRMR